MDGNETVNIAKDKNPMLHARLVYILGDIHGDFRALNDFINKEIRQDKSIRTIAKYWKDAGDDFRIMILQCGDFAYYWPGVDHGGIVERYPLENI